MSAVKAWAPSFKVPFCACILSHVNYLELEWSKPCYCTMKSQESF